MNLGSKYYTLKLYIQLTYNKLTNYQKLNLNLKIA